MWADSDCKGPVFVAFLGRREGPIACFAFQYSHASFLLKGRIKKTTILLHMIQCISKWIKLPPLFLLFLFFKSQLNALTLQDQDNTLFWMRFSEWGFPDLLSFTGITNSLASQRLSQFESIEFILFIFSFVAFTYLPINYLQDCIIY